MKSDENLRKTTREATRWARCHKIYTWTHSQFN